MTPGAHGGWHAPGRVMVSVLRITRSPRACSPSVYLDLVSRSLHLPSVPTDAAALAARTT